MLSQDHVDLLGEQPAPAPLHHCLLAPISLVQSVNCCKANRQPTLHLSMRLCKASCCVNAKSTVSAGTSRMRLQCQHHTYHLTDNLLLVLVSELKRSCRVSQVPARAVERKKMAHNELNSFLSSSCCILVPFPVDVCLLDTEVKPFKPPLPTLLGATLIFLP